MKTYTEEFNAMTSHTYIITYETADGRKKTASVVAPNHVAAVRFIEDRGGKVVYLDRDEFRPRKSRAVRHTVWAIVLFTLAALAVVAYFWHRMR